MFQYWKNIFQTNFKTKLVCIIQLSLSGSSLICTWQVLLGQSLSMAMLTIKVICPKKMKQKLLKTPTPKKQLQLALWLHQKTGFFLCVQEPGMDEERNAKNSNLTFQASHTPIAPTWYIGSHFMGWCKIEPLLTTTVICKAMKPHHKKTAQSACTKKQHKVLATLTALKCWAEQNPAQH